MTDLVIAPPIDVAANRMGAWRDPAGIDLFVLHTTEGSEGETSAEQLAAALERSGDRPTSGGGTYGPSYHWAFDTDRVLPAVPDNRVAYSAPGANHNGVHGVFPGRARQTRAEWLDPISRAYIAQGALLLVFVIGPAYDLPLVRLTVAQVRAGERGLCDHKTISDAFGRTDHWDVGPDFPWDVLAADIARLQEDDDMITLWKHPAYQNIWATNGGGWVHLSPALAGTYLAKNYELIEEAHAQTLKSALAGSGLVETDLVRV